MSAVHENFKYNEAEYLEQLEQHPIDLVYVSVDERIIIGSAPKNEEAARALSAYLERNHSKCFKLAICLTDYERFQTQTDDLLSPSNGFIDAPACIENYSMAPNTPGALKQLLRFCIAQDTYLSKQDRNVVVILCSTGRGRSAVVAACLSLHLGNAMSAIDAIEDIRRIRGPCSITFPSQIRYIHYYERLLRSQKGEFTQTLALNAVRITTIPSFDPSILNQGCSPTIAVSVLGQVAEPSVLESHAPFSNHVLYNQKELLAKERRAATFYSKNRGDREIEVDLRDLHISVRGDTIVSIFSGEHKMMQVCFHSAFVEEGYLRFDQSTVDLAHRDLHNCLFNPDLVVEFFFNRAADVPELNIADMVLPVNHDHLAPAEDLVACDESDEEL